MSGLKRIHVLFFLCSYGVIGTIFAQNDIKGVILDDKKAPAQFCTLVLLNNADSSIYKGNVTDDKGFFLFEKIKPGNYIIRTNAIGSEQTYSPQFTIDSLSQLTLDTITLKTSAINLNEISVTAVKKTIEFKDGMIVMNVENSPMTTGNTVFELLKRLPGVFIDAQNNIMLEGKSGIRILIDGRLQQLSGQQLFAVLSNMSADNVSKIEVMKNPPAKYDAAGSGGMINIVTKKVKVLGVSGNISSGVSKGYLWREGGDGSLNYKTKKITFFSNFGYGHRDFYSPYIFNKTIALPPGTTYLSEDGAQIRSQRMYYYKVGADFYLSDKTTIGVIASGGPASNPNLDTGINRASGYNTLGFDKMVYHALVGDDWRNPSYNVNAEHKFDTLGTTLNFSGDYTEFNGKRQNVASNDFLNTNDSTVLPSNNYRSTHITKIKIITQKLDFRKNLSNTFTFESGIKATFVDSRNDYTFEHQNNTTKDYFTDTVFSNVYQYNETVFAGYINFKKQFKKLNVQLGGREENTIVTGHNETSGFTLTRNYFNFFPNFSFDYPASEKHNFQLNLTRRIDRPNYNQLNPYKSYQDNFSATIGNPYLMPQYTYNTSLTYSYKQTIFNTFTYTRTDNMLFGYDYQNDTTKETISTIKNITGGNYFGYTLFIQKGLKKWWNLSASGTVYYTDYYGVVNNTNFSKNLFAYSAFLNNDFVLPKNFKVQCNFFYLGPGISGVGYYKDRWALDIGVRKTFFKNKLTVNLVFFDMFYKNITRMHSVFLNQNYIFNNKDDTRRLWLSISYKFGKLRIQKRDVVGNEQEKGRLNKDGGK